jgi:hypothetical protein
MPKKKCPMHGSMMGKKKPKKKSKPRPPKKSTYY